MDENRARQQEAWTKDGQYYEYSKAANPIGAGLIPPVPLADFPSRLHEEGPTQIIPFDLSEKLQLPLGGPATSPVLCANYIHIRAGDTIETRPNATSELYYVIRGRGQSKVGSSNLPWQQGDIFVLPAKAEAEHHADEDAAFYWVHDEPLLRYLGVTAATPRFQPTLYQHARAAEELKQIAEDPAAKKRNRVSVLLANTNFPQTRTITHVIWAMYGVLPTDSVQKAHRHESVALDFIIDCKPGCYTLIGRSIDKDEKIINPIRADWKPGAAFVTPPGLWHSHHNESGAPAHLMPIQDAGLHTHLRTLDIRFTGQTHEAHVSLKA